MPREEKRIQPHERAEGVIAANAALDAVKSPSHYTFAANPAYEVRRIIEALSFNWYLGSAFKYMARAGRKDPAKHVEDLEKAVEMIGFEIERVSKSPAPALRPPPTNADMPPLR